MQNGNAIKDNKNESVREKVKLYFNQMIDETHGDPCL